MGVFCGPFCYCPVCVAIRKDGGVGYGWPIPPNRTCLTCGKTYTGLHHVCFSPPKTEQPFTIKNYRDL